MRSASSTPNRYGDSRRAAIFVGGHHSGSRPAEPSPAPPAASLRRKTSPSPVMSRPRRTGLNGSGSMAQPWRAATASAAASACWAARPPCLTGKRRHVAGRVDVVEPVDAPVSVDRDEAVLVGGQAGRAPDRAAAGARTCAAPAAGGRPA